MPSCEIAEDQHGVLGGQNNQKHDTGRRSHEDPLADGVEISCHMDVRDKGFRATNQENKRFFVKRLNAYRCYACRTVYILSHCTQAETLGS